MTPETPAVVLRDVVKDYRGLRPLRLRDLKIAPGERVAVSGLDAMAAEVFVNLLDGSVLPDAGEVTVFGQSTAMIRTEDEWFAGLDRFGLVSERVRLLEGLTIEQNLALPYTIEIDALTPVVQSRIRAAAASVSLDAAWLPRPAGPVVPAGVRMRVQLARALAAAPRLMIFEHATASMDRDDVRPFAAAVRTRVEGSGLTTIVVSEDRTFIDAVCDRALTLVPATGELQPRKGWRRWF